MFLRFKKTARRAERLYSGSRRDRLQIVRCTTVYPGYEAHRPEAITTQYDQQYSTSIADAGA